MITEEVRKLIQALSRTQVSGGGNAVAGERIMYAEANIPLSDNFSVDVGGSSVKVPGFKQNMITNFGGNYITDDGLNVGLNANLQPNEYGKNRGLMATFSKDF